MRHVGSQSAWLLLPQTSRAPRLCFLLILQLSSAYLPLVHRLIHMLSTGIGFCIGGTIALLHAYIRASKAKRCRPYALFTNMVRAAIQ
jgi:hypothetical protein